MRIGVYGSSFDPITNVHLWTANTVRHRMMLDLILFEPASSKRPDKILQTEDHHRWNMMQLAIQDKPFFLADDYEITQVDGTHYTYYTMRHLKQKYPNSDLFFIMGADLLKDLSTWKYGEELVKENQFIVMARDGIDMLEILAKDPLLRNHQMTANHQPRFHLLHKGLAMEISSTYIRDEIRLGGDPEYLMPDPCYQYMKTHGLYLERRG